MHSKFYQQTSSQICVSPFPISRVFSMSELSWIAALCPVTIINIYGLLLLYYNKIIETI